MIKNKIGIIRWVKFLFPKEIKKEFRSDVQMWEAEMRVCGIRYYEYSIRVGAHLITKRSLLKIRSKKASYMPFIPLKTIIIGKKEFEEKYNGNKWIVPVNYELDLTRP